MLRIDIDAGYIEGEKATNVEPIGVRRFFTQINLALLARPNIRGRIYVRRRFRGGRGGSIHDPTIPWPPAERVIIFARALGLSRLPSFEKGGFVSS